MSATERTIPLARIRYGPAEQRWNPEPLAFEHFARRLAKDPNRKINIEIKVVAPGELAGCGAKVAHLTGTDAVEFSPEESNAIVAFLRGGGTLIVDQAGGLPVGNRKETFHRAFRAQVEAWFGPDALQPVGKDHPLLKDIGTLLYRNAEGQRRKRMPLALEHVTVDGRSVLYYSRYDLSCGLLGNPNPLLSGPEPAACYEVFGRLLVGTVPK